MEVKKTVMAVVQNGLQANNPSTQLLAYLKGFLFILPILMVRFAHDDRGQRDCDHN